MRFSFFGFPITITAASLLISALIGFSFGLSTGVPGAGAVGAVIVFGSIFLHELGHAFATRAVGAEVAELQMNGLGGFVARVPMPISAPASLFVTAAGPAVNLALYLVAKILIAMGFSHYAVQLVAIFNMLLLILNLLPIVPLDGGRILHAILMMFYADTHDGVVRPRRAWAKTPDQIVGTIGVIMGYLWVPMLIAVFYFFGILAFFAPPIAINDALAKGKTKLPL